TSDGFRQNSLRGFRRRKSGKVCLATKGRGVPGRNHGAFSCFEHLRSQSSRKIKQRHRIDLKVAVQHLGIDCQEVSERATNGIMNEYLRYTEVGTYCRQGGVKLCFIGNIT